MTNKILQVIAKAASPSERVDIFFEALSEQSNDIVLERETDWIKHVTGSNTLFQEILQARGISTETFKKQLYDVKVAKPEHLPQWAEVVVELMNPATFTGTPLEPFQSQVNQNKKVELPYQNAFQPFLRLAKQQLETWVSSCNFQVSATAKRKMLGSLLGRFYTVSSQTLTYKLNLLDVLVTGHGKIGYSIYDVFLSQPQVSRSNWLEVFELFPVLAKLLAVVYLNWRNSTAEFLERLIGDYKLLTETFFSGEEPGQLEDINLNAGDTHNQGRTVIIATFATGKKLVYKPKNLRIACSFMEFLNFLNSTGQILPLHTRKILLRSEYAWEEYVEFTCCKNTNEIRYFYHRIGMILRLLQLLQGRDFHGDNLIAFGDHPVLVDLENLFQPSVKDFSAKLTAEKEIFNRLDSSALNIGIISSKEYGEVGCRSIDFGVLAQGQEQVSSYKVTKVETLETGEVRIVKDFVSFQATNCLPYLQGEQANPQDYFDEILTGYRAMNNCLSLNSEELSKEDGIITKMAGMPIRYLYRSSSKYYRVIQESLAPACLRDGIKREISIERLWKAYLKSYHPSEIIQSEIDAIRNLDIPFFKALVDRGTIICEQGTEISAFFEGNILKKVIKQLQSLPNFSIESDIDLIKTAFFTLYSSPTNLSIPSLELVKKVTTDWKFPVQKSGLEQAVSIGEFILQKSTRVANEGQAWLGLNYLPWADAREVGLLKSNLLSGTCGLALVFADIYRLSAIPSFKQATYQILSTIARELETLPEVFAKCERSLAAAMSTTYYCGGFHGLGSQLYTLLRCGYAFNDSALIATATECIKSIPLSLLHKISPVDMVLGRAGLLLSLLSTMPAADSANKTEARSALIEFAIHLGEDLLATKDENGLFPPPPIPDGSTGLHYLPGTEAGIALALLKLYTVTGKPQFAFSQKDSALLSDTATKGDMTSGSILARLAAYQLHPDNSKSVLKEVEVFQDKDSSTLLSDHLLEHLEVAITAFQVSRQDYFYEKAQMFAEELVLRHNAFGSWFPEYLVSDQHNLSAISGLAAVAHAFLKLYSPNEIQSLRLLK